MISVSFVQQMEGNAPLSKENLNILCLLKKNTLVSVGFVCQVNCNLEPELGMPVIRVFGFPYYRCYKISQNLMDSVLPQIHE